MARKKGKSNLAAAAQEAMEEPVSSLPTSSARNLVDDRLSYIRDTDKIQQVKTLTVLPEECRLWERHNRRFDRLDEDNCRDLIDRFKAEGKQLFPAIVRRLPTKGTVKYEIISGARRFWTVKWLRANNYPDFKYLVEVRHLTDEEAFRLSDIENLERKDISDYERALDYASALDLYYDGKQQNMAERLNKPKDWMSRYLSLAKLPVQVANAYAEWHDLKTHHAPPLLRLMEKKDSCAKLLKKATELHGIHESRRLDGKKPMPGAEVFRTLKSAAEPKTKKASTVKIFGTKGQGHLELRAANPHGLTVHIPRSAIEHPDQLVKAFKECLKDQKG